MNVKEKGITMKKSLLALAAVGLLFSVGGAYGAAGDREDFDDNVKQINQMAEKPNVLRKALHHISVETGVPLEKVQQEHRRNPELGAAGLLIGNVLAAETSKEPDRFFRQNANGKKWTAIARENDVSLDKLNTRLENLEEALEPVLDEEDKKRRKRIRDR
jgi:hypothetical protein